MLTMAKLLSATRMRHFVRPSSCSSSSPLRRLRGGGGCCSSTSCHFATEECGVSTNAGNRDVTEPLKCEGMRVGLELGGELCDRLLRGYTT